MGCGGWLMADPPPGARRAARLARLSASYTARLLPCFAPFGAGTSSPEEAPRIKVVIAPQQADDKLNRARRASVAPHLARLRRRGGGHHGCGSSAGREVCCWAGTPAAYEAVVGLPAARPSEAARSREPPRLRRRAAGGGRKNCLVCVATRGAGTQACSVVECAVRGVQDAARTVWDVGVRQKPGRGRLRRKLVAGCIGIELKRRA
jgi:hypothetical protein